MSQFEITFWNDAGKYYTITEAIHQKVISRTLEWTENYPRKLTFQLENRTTIATDNLLSASFAGWDSGTGAIDIGTRVNYFVYPESAPTTKTEVFWGIITEISQTSGGILTIVARDYLEKYEYIQPTAIIFNTFRDQQLKLTTEHGETRTIDGITETGIMLPPLFVGVATTDIQTDLNTVSNHNADIADGVDFWEVAQAFLAKGDGLIGVNYNYSTAAVTVVGNIYCTIQADLDGLPSGVDIATFETLIGMGTNFVNVQVNYAAVGYPILLEPGAKYWIIWRCDQTIVGGVAINYGDTLPTNPYTDRRWYRCLTPIDVWTESAADQNMDVVLDFCNYDEIAADDYYYDGPNDRIVVRVQSNPITTVAGYYTIRRGKVSFYYGSVSTQTVFERLIGYDPDVYDEVSGDCDTTLSLYQTRGKSIAECFRELCDTFETTGAYSGYQHIVAAYRNGDDEDIIKVGFKPWTGSRVFSHGADTSTDDEVRIISLNLKRTTSLRPASVIVIGKDPSGGPIIVERDDQGLGASSFRTKSKMALLTSHTDEAINSIADADRKAWQILDSLSRNVWEGTITVAGIFPDLFCLDNTSVFYGAGGHIHLNYSPLGISNVQLHVKGIVLHENTTEVQVSNDDLLLLNALTDTRGRAERSESFLAPDDPYTTVFISKYVDVVEDLATLYMQLCTADNTCITEGFRVLCTKTSNSRYNSNTYHAEFATINGHTVDGTPVNRLELYTLRTLGTEHVEALLLPSEYFPKWRTTHVIAEIHTKIA
jgi:hypothetical protein